MGGAEVIQSKQASPLMLVAQRAENRHRQTGKPTCGVCRHMTVLPGAEAANCMVRFEQFEMVAATSLASLTAWARTCPEYEGMVDTCES